MGLTSVVCHAREAGHRRFLRRWRLLYKEKVGQTYTAVLSSEYVRGTNTGKARNRLPTKPGRESKGRREGPCLKGHSEVPGILAMFYRVTGRLHIVHFIIIH